MKFNLLKIKPKNQKFFKIIFICIGFLIIILILEIIILAKISKKGSGIQIKINGASVEENEKLKKYLNDAIY